MKCFILDVCLCVTLVGLTTARRWPGWTKCVGKDSQINFSALALHTENVFMSADTLLQAYKNESIRVKGRIRSRKLNRLLTPSAPSQDCGTTLSRQLATYRAFFQTMLNSSFCEVKCRSYRPAIRQLKVAIQLLEDALQSNENVSLSTTVVDGLRDPQANQLTAAVTRHLLRKSKLAKVHRRNQRRRRSRGRKGSRREGRNGRPRHGQQRPRRNRQRKERGRKNRPEGARKKRGEDKEVGDPKRSSSSPQQESAREGAGGTPQSPRRRGRFASKDGRSEWQMKRERRKKKRRNLRNQRNSGS